MEEKWLKLYKKLKKIEENFLDIEKRSNLVPIQECMLEIQNFAVWFLEKNQLEEEPQKWEEKKRELLCILQDIIITYFCFFCTFIYIRVVNNHPS